MGRQNFSFIHETKAMSQRGCRSRQAISSIAPGRMKIFISLPLDSFSASPPFRWMPPEAIERHRWSEKSDVWAFAVTLWEMFTHGKVPYTFVASDAEVAQRVVAGELRLERPLQPTECPEGLFAVMKRCWAARAADRPTFADLKRLLLEEVKVVKEGECCICMQKLARNHLLALVPCGHRCVCAHHAVSLVGQNCPLCRVAVREAIRVFD